MRLVRSYTIVAIWLCAIFALGWFRLDLANFNSSFVYTVLTSPTLKLKDQVPVGEVVTGFYLEQPISWVQLDKAVSDGDFASSVCLNVLLANYDNRQNQGSFSLKLLVDDASYQVIEKAAEVIDDNAYHRVCFDKLVLGDIVNKPVSLVLEGVDGRTGSAINAWMTSDTVHGTALLNGKVLNKSLVFKLETIRESPDKVLITIILTLIYCLSGIFLLWPIFGRYERAPSE